MSNRADSDAILLVLGVLLALTGTVTAAVVLFPILVFFVLEVATR